MFWLDATDRLLDPCDRILSAVLNGRESIATRRLWKAHRDQKYCCLGDRAQAPPFDPATAISLPFALGSLRSARREVSCETRRHAASQSCSTDRDTSRPVPAPRVRQAIDDHTYGPHQPACQHVSEGGKQYLQQQPHEEGRVESSSLRDLPVGEKPLAVLLRGEPCERHGGDQPRRQSAAALRPPPSEPGQQQSDRQTDQSEQTPARQLLKISVPCRCQQLLRGIAGDNALSEAMRE